jgi:hypothetical protein
MIITKKDGTPFSTASAAKLRLGALKKKGEVKEGTVYLVEGGYAIETPEEQANNSLEVENLDSIELTSDWEEVKLLDIPEKLKVKGRIYRWCNTAIQGNIDKKIAQGWVIDRDMYKKRDTVYGEFKAKTQSLGTEIRIRELILMWLPEARAAKRNQFYAEKAAKAAAEPTAKGLHNVKY